MNAWQQSNLFNWQLGTFLEPQTSGNFPKSPWTRNTPRGHNSTQAVGTQGDHNVGRSGRYEQVVDVNRGPIPDLNATPGLLDLGDAGTPSQQAVPILTRTTLFTWKHSIFAHRMSRRFKPVSRIWLLLRGAILWMIWKERNDAAFSGLHWHIEKVCCKVWLEMMDYGRMAWTHTKADMKKNGNNPEKAAQILLQFKNSWCKKLLAKWDGIQPCWNLLGPSFSTLSEV